MINNLNKSISKYNAYINKVIFPNSLNGIRILCYHSVNSVSDLVFNPTTNLILSDFIPQMNYLKENNFECINFEEMENYIEGRYNILKKYFILSFDDGFKNIMTNVLPILNLLNYNCIIFISTGHIGLKIRLDYELSGNNNKYNYPREVQYNEDYLPLTEEDIYRLSCNKNVLIGSHGCTHLPYTKLSDKEIINENVQSKNKLENITGYKINHFAFPNGEYDKRSYDLTSKHYRYIYGVKKGLVVKGMATVKPMNRHSIHNDCDIEEFHNQIYGGYDWIQKLFRNIFLKI